MDGIYVVALITALIIGLLPAFIASSKGKDFFTWYIYGVLLFFFAMIHAIVLPEKPGSGQDMVQDIKKGIIPLKEIPAPNLYKEPLLRNPNSPVEMISYSIKLTRDSEKAFANVKLRNITSKAVVAVKLKIRCYDAFNEPVQSGGNVIEKSLQDLYIKPGAALGDDALIDLHELTDARKLQLIITSVLFDDGSMWNYSEEDLIEVSVGVLEDEALDDLRFIAGKDAFCYAKETLKYWQCVCGHANTLLVDQCKSCNRNKSFILYCFAEGSDLEVYHERLKGEEFQNLKEVAGLDAVCYSNESSKYWQCVCGQVNAPIAEQCERCNRKKRVVLIYYAGKCEIEEELLLITAKEAKLKQLDAENKRIQNKKTRTKVIIGASVFFVVVVAIIYLINIPPTVDTGDKEQYLETKWKY